MTTISLLPGSNVHRSIFTTSHLQQLSGLGSLRINEEERNPTSERVQELIRGAGVAVTSWGCPPLSKEILDQAPDLKLIVHAAGTVKGIMTDEVIRRGLRVSSANDALGVGVAETTLGIMIATLKNMWDLSRFTREGEWNKGKADIRELYGLTVGVIGAGKAGRHFIRLLHHFEVDIVLFDPLVSEEDAAQLGVRKVSLPDLLKQSDVVSIHAPSIEATKKMMNRETLAMMKDQAILINTARGALIDEEALIAELRTGRITACLDVTDPEPPRPDHPFRTLPNVVLLPHIAGAVNNGKQRLAAYAIEEIRRFLSGRALHGEVELSLLDVIA